MPHSHQLPQQINWRGMRIRNHSHHHWDAESFPTEGYKLALWTRRRWSKHQRKTGQSKTINNHALPLGKSFSSPGCYSTLFIQKAPSPYLPVFILPVVPFPYLGGIGQWHFYRSAGVSTSHDNSSTLGWKTLCVYHQEGGDIILIMQALCRLCPVRKKTKKDPAVFPKWKQATEDRETVVSFYLTEKPESKARGLHSHVPLWMGRRGLNSISGMTFHFTCLDTSLFLP